MEYQPIEGKGNQGQFVHAGQDMASKQGFGNVSKLWYDKTISYDEGMELLEHDRGHRQDYLVTRGQMQVAVRQASASQCQRGLYLVAIVRHDRTS